MIREQFKRSSFLTKLVVVTLIIAATVTLLRMQGQIQQAQTELEAARLRVARQIQVNADLQDAVDHSDDPQRQADIAREELGLVSPGEKVIVFTD